MDVGCPVVVIRAVVKKKRNKYLAGFEVTNWYNFYIIIPIII